MSNSLRSHSLKLTLAGVGIVACALAGVGLHSRPAQALPDSAGRNTALSSALPGRYQLQDVGGTAYLLDTATGRIWYERQTSNPNAAPSPDDGVITAANGQSIRFHAPVRSWVEDSPTWARPQ